MFGFRGRNEIAERKLGRQRRSRNRGDTQDCKTFFSQGGSVAASVQAQQRIESRGREKRQARKIPVTLVICSNPKVRRMRDSPENSTGNQSPAFWPCRNSAATKTNGAADARDFDAAARETIDEPGKKTPQTHTPE